MNGKRVNVEELIACGNVFDSFFIEERVGESDKAFHDFTTCGRSSYRVKSTRAWERIQEKQKSMKAWGRVYKASHLRSNPRRSAIAIPRNFSKFVAPLASLAPRFGKGKKRLSACRTYNQVDPLGALLGLL